MKKLLTVFALSILPGLAYAAGGTVPALTYQVGVSSITTNIITVTTVTANSTQMDNPTMQQRVAVEIQNIDSSANLWCLPTSSPTVNSSRKIASGGTWVISVRDRMYVPTDPTKLYSSTNTNFYCISDGAASTKAAVSQIY